MNTLNILSNGATKTAEASSVYEKSKNIADALQAKGFSATAKIENLNLNILDDVDEDFKRFVKASINWDVGTSYFDRDIRENYTVNSGRDATLGDLLKDYTEQRLGNQRSLENPVATAAKSEQDALYSELSKMYQPSAHGIDKVTDFRDFSSKLASGIEQFESKIDELMKGQQYYSNEMSKYSQMSYSMIDLKSR